MDRYRLKRVVHGTPITPIRLLENMRGESFCVSHFAPAQLDMCINLMRGQHDQVLILDNGAYSHWQAGGGSIDREKFWTWANEAQGRCDHAVAVIPDVIEGSEQDNLLECSWAVREGMADYPERCMAIWHLDDSIEQLKTFCRLFNFVGLGSCAEFDVQKNKAGYLARLREASAVIDYVEMRYARRPWIHLMRGLGMFPKAIRFESADSCNVAMNHHRYRDSEGENRAQFIADRTWNKVHDASREAGVGHTFHTTNFEDNANE